VLDLGSGTSRLTDERGELRTVRPRDGALRLRVRQIGFRAVERQLHASAAVPDTLTFALRRVTFTLPGVFATAESRCAPATDSLSTRLSATVLEQLRLGAGHYERFRRAYPFRVREERRTVTLGRDGKPVRVTSRFEQFDSGSWDAKYETGSVIQSQPLGFSVPILFVTALADERFWRAHCFAVHGIETVAGGRALRLGYFPTPNVRTVDWEGSALVDSATGLLRRVEFRLTGLRDDDLPRRLEGYTTFRSPSPFVVVPDSTVAMWWRRGPGEDGEWRTPDVVQLLRVDTLRFRKGTPPPSPLPDR
jgi:hypothetical protein